MKIAINGQQLGVRDFAGPEMYIFNTIKALGKIDNENKYTIFLEKEPQEEVMKAIKNLPSNFQTKILPKIISWTQVSLAIELLKGDYDVLFSALHTIPILAVNKLKLVSMIHGLEYVSNKETQPFIKSLLIGKPEWLTCRFSHKIVVPSQATKEAISSTKWKLKNPEIEVISEGVSENFYMQSAEIPAKALEKYKIPQKPYLTFVSTIQPRKNLKSIVEAISILKYSNGVDINLLVCGKKGWNYEEEITSPEKFAVRDQVFFLGRIPDDDLVAALSGAKAFISASYEEGFGLNLLEAMACEIPTIVSDIPAYKTLAEDTAIYINPYSPEDIAKKIISFLEEPQEEIEKRVKKAKQKSKDYTWEKSAEKLVNVFENATKTIK